MKTSFSVDAIGNTGVIICYDKERKMKYRVSNGKMITTTYSILHLSLFIITDNDTSVTNGINRE
jgi:hypothetical protein